MAKLTWEQLIERLSNNQAQEHLVVGLELKSSWSQDHGKDLSALANQESFEGGWVVIGIDDTGHPSGRDAAWLKKTEEQVSQHILQFLAPYWAVRSTRGHAVPKGHILVLDVINPGEVVEWNGRAFKVSGTISTEMTPDEELKLSLRLPGEDYSRTEWTGDPNGALVLEYARKVRENRPDEEGKKLDALSPSDILSKLSLNSKTAAGILFGDYRYRIVHFDQRGDVLDQRDGAGLYGMLTDAFVEGLQSWTRKAGTVVRGSSTSVVEELPYPPRALREVLANAVAHAFYARDQGNIVVEARPDRLTISNNCAIESKAFVEKWFSRESCVRNKLLMVTLRIAGVTDELGSGKSRIFRQMIESGRREPIIEFAELNRYGRWSVTLYNEETSSHIQNLISRLKECFSDSDKWRISVALVLWRDKSWAEIENRLDQHYQRVALEVIRDEQSPVIVVGNEIFLRRWAQIALTGQTSRRFTVGEEEQIKSILKAFAFDGARNGHFANEDARRIIGLSNSQSEIVQLSNLFRKWASKDEIQQVKRGQWKFFTRAEQQQRVIMAILSQRKSRTHGIE